MISSMLAVVSSVEGVVRSRDAEVNIVSSVVPMIEVSSCEEIVRGGEVEVTVLSSVVQLFEKLSFVVRRGTDAAADVVSRRYVEVNVVSSVLLILAVVSSCKVVTRGDVKVRVFSSVTPEESKISCGEVESGRVAEVNVVFSVIPVVGSGEVERGRDVEVSVISLMVPVSDCVSCSEVEEVVSSVIFVVTTGSVEWNAVCSIVSLIGVFPPTLLIEDALSRGVFEGCVFTARILVVFSVLSVV